MNCAHHDILDLESLAEITFDDGRFDEHLALWAPDHVELEGLVLNRSDGSFMGSSVIHHVPRPGSFRSQ